MLGYHNRPEEDREVFTEDGGLRTGDLGFLDEDGYLFITGRIKELYKLETGKYIAPAALEEKLKLSPLVANVLLFGANKPYNVALIVPDEATLGAWAKQHQLSPQQARTNDSFKQLVMDDLNKHCQDFKGYERPRKIALLAEDFTTNNGLLTPSMKIKRREAVQRYQDVLDSLY